MKEILCVVYDYMKTIVIGDDLDRAYANFVYEQLVKFVANVEWYMENWKDNFSDYVDDLMQIAADEIENKGIFDIHNNILDIIEAVEDAGFNRG